MAEDNTNPEQEIEQKGSRRDFVRTSAAVAVTAPAVAVLLSASTKPAAAQSAYNAVNLHVLDDFSFGNDHEDIDAIKLGSNFNPNNGSPQKDDHLIP